jgi:hypothetical protein
MSNKIDSRTFVFVQSAHRCARVPGSKENIFMDRLPKDVLGVILNYVLKGSVARYGTIIRVCKLWRQVANLQVKYMPQFMHVTEFTAPYVLNFVNLQNVRVLRASDSVANAIRQLENLRSVEISFSKLQDCSIWSSLEKITELELNSSEISGEFYDWVFSREKLRHIILDSNFGLKSDYTIPPSPIIALSIRRPRNGFFFQNCTQLQQLEIKDELGVRTDITMLSKLTQLSSLIIFNSYLDNNIAFPQSLKKLELHCSLQKGTFQSGALVTLTNLENFSSQNNLFPFSEEELLLFASLPKLYALTIPQSGEWEETRESFLKLSQKLASVELFGYTGSFIPWTQLTQLRLLKCKVDFEDLSNLTNLLDLCIKDPQLGDPKSMNQISSLSKLKILEIVDENCNSVSQVSFLSKLVNLKFLKLALRFDVVEVMPLLENLWLRDYRLECLEEEEIDETQESEEIDEISEGSTE